MATLTDGYALVLPYGDPSSDHLNIRLLGFFQQAEPGASVTWATDDATPWLHGFTDAEAAREILLVPINVLAFHRDGQRLPEGAAKAIREGNAGECPGVLTLAQWAGLDGAMRHDSERRFGRSLMT